MTDYTAFKVELSNHIAHVQINRPEKINAMNAAFWSEIVEIFQWIDDTDEARVVVISGAGKHFSSGIDLMMLASIANELGKDVGRNARLLRRKILQMQASFNAIDNCRKPVLAAIQGYCIGGAIDLIAACDMRYAASDAQFSIKEIDMGMAADVGTLQRLPRIIGDGLLRELAYTGRTIDAEEARRIGLVNRTWDDHASLLDGVFAIAAQIAGKSPIAVAGTKEMLSYMRDHRIDDGLEYIATWNAAMLQSTDLRVAVAAHMSKQKPEFADGRGGEPLRNGNMSARWTTAVLDTTLNGGLAVVRSAEGFMQDGNGALFPRDWLKRQELDIRFEHGIGHYDGQPVYLIELHGSQALPGCSWRGLRQFMLEGDFDTYKILGYAAQISTWAREHRFCGSCGQAMVQVPRERAMYCQPCDLRSYPRISPSMIVLITRGDEILLARSPRFVTGVYSTLAGFAEPGESAEDCLVREVREEVAIAVKNIQYVGSQCWPFPHSMMLGFHAEYAGGEIVMQPDEIEDAQWFRVDALPPLPAGRSIARYLIDLYVARRLGLAEPVLPR